MESLSRPAVRRLPMLAQSVHAADLCAASASVASAALFAGIALLRYNSFNATAFDLGFFDQVVWQIARGRPGFTSYVPYNFFGQHVEPVLFLFGGLYKLWADPRLLLLSQASAVGVAAWLLHRCARQVLGAWASVACAIAFLAAVPLHNALAFDFHPEVMSGLPLFAGLLLALKGRPWAAAAVWCSLLVFKEDEALLLPGLGLLLLLSPQPGRSRRLSPILLSLSSRRRADPDSRSLGEEGQGQGETRAATWPRATSTAPGAPLHILGFASCLGVTPLSPALPSACAAPMATARGEREFEPAGRTEWVPDWIWPGLTLAIVGIVWAALAAGVIEPHWRHGHTGDLAENYAAAIAALSHPRTLVGVVFGHGGAAALLDWIGGTGLAPLLAPLGLLAAAPELLLHLASGHETQHILHLHYGIEAVPVIYAFLLIELRWLRSHPRIQTGIVLTVTAVTIAAFAVSSPFRAGLPFGIPSEQHLQTLQEAVRLVPPDAALRADSTLAAHLSQRPAVFEFPGPNWGTYVVLDANAYHPNQSLDAAYQAAVAVLPIQGYAKIFDHEGVQVWRR